ncbi:transporter substrate-binding domain-containing protein [Pimelobacter simplex]|uniref:Amino acid ABC transporter, amino acid-binding/permease protein n=1 Tax=Nocardioides simplex TaxID=2045 RepID=A0A0C5XB83_NOCSI|nr:transporter substrate-binding domain-containing protein [Pimelobacter simplex]AJR18064.1 Amino acid ABC transporter, amino acid-binding/permease protein [Pimelobacter simplex]MCG8150880.1 transporter substrate-binding domain-containing protein [Pimelobacter simplex]GEB12484.1 amino acid ABC transporter substrate-binding protein [Pimelobacter simplex]SFM94410.1 amino acid ABC transporter substrate-binding protein, PAAT family [Pimelobacter simplex]
MKMRRPLAALACGLMAAAAAGCGTSDESGTSSPPAGCKPAHPDVPTLSKGRLNVLVYVTPPYTTKEGATYGGVEGAIVKEIAKLECLELKEQSVSAAAGLASIGAGRADLVVGGIYYTEERAQTLGLSAPMYRDGMALLSKDELGGTLADLEGKTVGVIQGYLWNEDFQKELGSDNVKLYQDSASLLTDVKNGRVDAAVLTSAEAGYRAAQDSGLTTTAFQSTPEIAASATQNDVVIALPKDKTDLIAAVDDDIRTLIENGTVADVLKDNGMDPDLAGPGS